MKTFANDLGSRLLVFLLLPLLPGAVQASGSRLSTQDRDEVAAAVRAFATAAQVTVPLEEMEIDPYISPAYDFSVSTPEFSLTLKRIGGTLRVIYCRNGARLRERQRLKGVREGENSLDEAATRARAREVAAALVPEWTIRDGYFKYYVARESYRPSYVVVDTGGGDECGAARYFFDKMEPEGPVFGRQSSVSITVDAMDGVLLLCSWSPGLAYEITSRDGTVTEQEARDKAKTVALAVHGVDMGAYETTAVQGFAGVTGLPGVERRRRAQAPYEHRFAWRIKALSILNGYIVQDLFVDIDAQTGEVLNTYWMKPERPPGQ